MFVAVKCSETELWKEKAASIGCCSNTLQLTLCIYGLEML